MFNLYLATQLLNWVVCSYFHLFFIFNSNNNLIIKSCAGWSKVKVIINQSCSISPSIYLFYARISKQKITNVLNISKNDIWKLDLKRDRDCLISYKLSSQLKQSHIVWNSLSAGAFIHSVRTFHNYIRFTISLICMGITKF
jgi:hypothetical protein